MPTFCPLATNTTDENYILQMNSSVNLQETAIDLKGLLDHQILSSRDAPHTSGAELMKGN